MINNSIQKFYNQANLHENRIDKPLHPQYNYISKLKYKLGFNKIINELKTTYLIHGKNSQQFQKIYDKYKTSKQKFDQYTKIQQSLPSFLKRRQTLRFCYIRYADDWIFLTNADYKFTSNLKDVFSDWIQNNLQLELHPTKTKITDLSLRTSKIHFLGFQLSYALVKRKQTIQQVTGNTGFVPSVKVKSPFKQRTTNSTLIAAWDRKRVFSKLKESRFITRRNNNWYGRSKPEWSILEAPEIIQRYNYVIRGYIDYYSPITHYPTDVHQLFYLLKFSCIHTLANKYNTSLRSIIKKFGKDITINYQVKQSIKKQLKTIETVKNYQVKLLNWKSIKIIIASRIRSYHYKVKSQKPLSTIYKSVDEIPKVKINWRTKYKLELNECPICGCHGPVEYHHVKHIRIGKVTGFLQVLNQLGRRQIPCCKQCHIKIHNGTYDQMSVSDLYNSQLIIL